MATTGMATTGMATTGMATTGMATTGFRFDTALVQSDRQNGSECTIIVTTIFFEKEGGGSTPSKSNGSKGTGPVSVSDQYKWISDLLNYTVQHEDNTNNNGNTDSSNNNNNNNNEDDGVAKMDRFPPTVLENDEIYGMPKLMRAISTSTYQSWESNVTDVTSCYDQYLKRSLGTYLSQCLQELIELKPRDPIEFIAQYLYRCVDSEQYHKEKIKFLQDLVQQKKVNDMEKRRRQQAMKQMFVAIQEQKKLLQELRLAEIDDIMETLSLKSPTHDPALLQRLKELASSTKDNSLLSEVEHLEKQAKGRRRTTVSALTGLHRNTLLSRAVRESIPGTSSKWSLYKSTDYADDDSGTRLPDGSVQFSDGTIRKLDGTFVFPDGSVEFPDGTKRLSDGTTRFTDGTILHSDGRVTDPSNQGAVRVDSSGNVHYPDGAQRMPDGSVTYPDGTVIYPDEDGNVRGPDGISRYPDGTVEMPDGTKRFPDGSVRYPDNDPRSHSMDYYVDRQGRKYKLDTIVSGTSLAKDGDSRKSGKFKIGSRGFLEFHDRDMGVLSPRLPPIPYAGRVEVPERLPNGSIRFPDGHVSNPDGTTLFPDGSVQYPDGTMRLPDGMVLYQDGEHPVSGRHRKPNGSVVYPDGSVSHPDKDGVVRDPDGAMRYPDGTVLLPDSTILYPDGSVRYPDWDPRSNAMDYFVDSQGNKHRLDSVNALQLEDAQDSVRTAMRSGKFKVNSRGYLEFHDVNLGIISPKLPPITSKKNVDDPKYWMTNDFACESLYDHELYTVCGYEVPVYPKNVKPMSIDEFTAPVLPPSVLARLMKEERLPSGSSAGLTRRGSSKRKFSQQ
ncbi:hypothetical protein Btru_057058 [Bulinus truncatus]|nr:hypothetical protein Btru_057058 [Bulinus truncatus]